ncbi:hypothetical protein CSA57_11075 [candidate division KSB3 bacterium]|nr:MAG: hypothetical protein CSA57_11075 [candidate division KSB3 bacterium]
MKLPDGNEIPPGGEIRVAVTIRTRARRRSTRQVIKVESNDPQHAAFSLTVHTNVLVDVDVVPNRVLRFRGENAKYASVILKNYSGNSVELLGIDSSLPSINVSLSSMTIPPDGEVLLQAELLPDTPKGLLSGWLNIKTTLESLPLIQVRIWGNIK